MVGQDPTSSRTSRRNVLKAGVAATGAAYVAPQIVNTAIAGAQTTTCFVFKLENGGCNALNGIVDPSCDQAFNDAIAASISGTVVSDCSGASMVSITSGAADGTSLTATVQITSPNCTFAFAGYKAGPDCYTTDHATVSLSNGDTVAMISSARRDISHITLVVCCTGSP